MKIKWILTIKRLHWLPISYRIEFKIATLTFKVRETGHPEHFKPIVADRLPTRVLRSSDKHFLTQPPVKTEIAKRAFSQAAPSVWNSLPLNCRTANTFSIFKKLLKTHIFKHAYPDWSCDNFPRPWFIACIAVCNCIHLTHGVLTKTFNNNNNNNIIQSFGAEISSRSREHGEKCRNNGTTIVGSWSFALYQTGVFTTLPIWSAPSFGKFMDPPWSYGGTTFNSCPGSCIVFDLTHSCLLPPIRVH